MLVSIRAKALGILGALALTAVASANEGWIADYDEAVKAAKAQNKDLFIDFTGSDWCVWCKKLDAEVFSHEEFMKAASKDFVFVSLDFPHSDAAKAKVPNAKRNQELMTKYGIQGFPTVLLMTPDGDVFGQTGYQPGGPEAYATHLAGLKTKGKAEVAQAKTLLEAWNKATPAEKGAAWDKLAAAFTTMGAESFAAKSLVDPVKAALEFDKDNAQGRKKRAVGALLQYGVTDEDLLAAGREYDPKNADGLLELCVQAQFRAVQDDETARAALTGLDAFDAANLPWKKKELAFQLHAMAASWCAEPLADPVRAKKYAAKAKEIGTDDAEALKMLEKILGDTSGG
jgi:thioredoxin-related protein